MRTRGERPPEPERSVLARLLADGVGYALASFVLGVLALVWSIPFGRGYGIAAGAALVAAAIAYGRAAWNASINTVLSTAGSVLAAIAILVLVAHNPTAVVGIW